jgi:hypothetical protein
MASEKLEAARRKGDLTAAIGAMREEGATKAGAIVPDMDATFATVANPAVVTVGMLRDLGANDLSAGPGKSVSVDNRPSKDSPEVIAARKTGNLERVLKARREQTPVIRTALTREQKLAKTSAWAQGLTQDQRDEYIVSEHFEGLTDRAQEIISEVFGRLEDRAYENSIGIENIDFDAPTPDVDSIIGDEPEDEVIEYHEGNPNYDEHFDSAAWEAEQTS